MTPLLFTLALFSGATLAAPTQTLFPKITLIGVENHTPACSYQPLNIWNFIPGCKGDTSNGGCGAPSNTSFHLFWEPTPWYTLGEQVKAGGRNSLTCSISATFEFEAGKYKLSPVYSGYAQYGTLKAGSSVTVQTSTAWADNAIKTPVCLSYSRLSFAN